MNLCVLTHISFYASMQIVVWRFLKSSTGSDVFTTKQALLYIILLQYIPRFARVIPLTSELKRTTGVFAETAWAGAASYLLLYMLASHVSSQAISFTLYDIFVFFICLSVFMSLPFLFLLSMQGKWG